MSEVRLHLGCGRVHLPGWTNVDQRYQPGVDLVDNIGLLRGLADGSIDEIYAAHCLDHFTRWEYPRVLKRWHALLKPGGILRLSVPDFDAIVDRYRETSDLQELQGLLCAGQDYEGNVRHVLWNHSMLARDLIQTGFYGVGPWDWRETDNAHVDDCSQAYLPHMDKENGRLMSLNLKGVKN